MLLSPGCACLALRFRKSKTLSIHDYFALGSSVILSAAKEELGLELFLRGTSDLACATPDGDRKVAGSALYMPRDFVLYLVSILVSPDLGQMETYLAHPSKEPEYRAGRGHGAFLAGLAGLSGRDVRAAQVSAWLAARVPERLAGDLDWESAGVAPQAPA